MPNNQYEFNSTNLNKLNIKLLYVTSAIYDVDWHSIMHSHPFTELFYVLKGSGRMHIENDVFNVKEDDLVIVNANISHTESSKGKEPFEYVVLGIENIELLTSDENNYSIHNYENYKHEILFYIKTLLIEAKNQSEYHDLISQDLLEILIVNIIRRTKTNLTIGVSKKINHDCLFIENYINQHYSEDLTLDKLCSLTYMNKFYLVHAFKKYKGISPIAYLNEKRLVEAKKLLKNTSHSIAQIANIIGMSSQSYFSQAFKNRYNMSPHEYRKQFQVE